MIAPTNRLSLAVESRENSIGFLRFLFAGAVLCSHSFALGGFGVEPLRSFSGGRESLGTMAVQCFFVLSGFLITRSYAHSSGLFRFLWHRVLRIMPGYWVCLVVTAVVFGPLHFFTLNHTLAGYFSIREQGPLSYVIGNAALIMQEYSIFGMPLWVPLPHSFDGSLWSLKYEFRCYLYLALVGALGLLRRFPRAGSAVVLMLIVVPIVAQDSPGLASRVTWLGDEQMLVLMPYFFAGALLYLLRGWIVLNRWLAAALCLLVIASLRAPALVPLRPAALAYVVFWLGYRLPFSRFDARGDFSYGFYIYAFPVQQTLALWQVHTLGVVVYILASSVLTFALAVGSYHLIERPCRRLKSIRMPFGRPARP